MVYGSTVISKVSNAEMILLVLIHKQHQEKILAPCMQTQEW